MTDYNYYSDDYGRAEDPAEAERCDGCGELADVLDDAVGPVCFQCLACLERQQAEEEQRDPANVRRTT